MAGGSKLKCKWKKKYRKMQPEDDDPETPEQEKRGDSNPEQEPHEQTKQGKTRRGKKGRSRKKVHLRPLPNRYDPMEEGAPETESREDKNYKRKQKAKKYAKNVGKAVQTGCRYLLIGIQGLTNAYMAPFNVSSVIVSSMAR